VKALKTRMRLPKWFKDESGAATFEFTIALPVYMMLVFFAIAICWFWWRAPHGGTEDYA